MHNSTLKKIAATIIICLSALVSKAQIGYNYSQFDVGIAGSVNTVYGDAQSQKNTPSINISFTYNQTPFINYIFDFQAGNLAGGNEIKDVYGRQFSNNFTAYSGRVQVQAGEFIDYSQSSIANGFKNLYLSTGIGYIVNNNSTNRYSYQIPSFYTPGENSSNEIFIPCRLGYEFKFFNSYDEPAVKIDLSYQYNFVMGDELDGFDAGKHNDRFTQLSLGIKVAIGGETSYKKQISY